MPDAAAAPAPRPGAPAHAEVLALLDEAERRYYAAPAEVLRLADEAIARLGPAAPLALLARARRVRGIALAFTGRHADALAELRAALELVPDDEPALRCKVLRGLAIACDEAGTLDDGLEWSVRASEVARAVGDPALLAGTLLTVGVALSRTGRPEAGLDRYREAFALYEQVGDRVACANVLNNIGINCKNLDRHEEALQSLRRAIAIAGSERDAGIAAIATLNLAEALARAGQRDAARAAVVEAAERAAAVGYASAECVAQLLLGELLTAEGDDAGAAAALERGLAIARDGGGRNHVARAHKGLWTLHKAAGRFEAALAHHEAFHEAERAQFNDESDRRLRALQVRFDLERAQHEAAMARRESARLAEQSRLDALTGVANRRHLEERLRDEYARALRQGHPLSVAMADADDFKRINDRCGHAVGDAVLREIATLLSRHCRDTDLVARYGGEEFCVVFVEATAAEARRAAESMRTAVAGHDWSMIAPGLAVTLSIGLAERDEADGRQALLAAADARLYEAKRGGKNRVVAGSGAAA